MSDPDADWVRRHIAAFRYHRGHQACTVDGCTGSQPLMWVPTEAEDREMPVLEAEVIVLAAQAEIALDDLARRKSTRRMPDLPRPNHIHWAWPTWTT